MDELAAEELGALVVEQDRGDVVVDRQPTVVERGQVVRIGRPRPGVDAPPDAVPVAAASSAGVMPPLAGRAEPREQPSSMPR